MCGASTASAALQRISAAVLHVLLVEPLEAEAARVQALLSPLPDAFSVASQPDAARAKEALETEDFDAVLVGAGALDAFQLSALRELAPDTAVILLQDYDESPDGSPDSQDGFADRLVRNHFDLDLLVRSIRGAVERQRLLSELVDARRKLDEIPLKDPLTGLLNRKGIDRSLVREARAALRESQPLLALLVVLEGLGALEASSGPDARDAAVREMAERLRQAFRDKDVVSRVADSEFLVLMPGTRLGEGRRTSERIHRTLVGAPLVLYVQRAQVALRTGLIEVPLERTVVVEEVLDLARRALRTSQDPEQAPESGALPLPQALDALRNAEPFHTVKLPIIRLSDGQKVGYEIWSRSSVRGFERPEDFFRISHEGNILAVVDQACLRKCLASVEKVPLVGRYHVNLFPTTLLKVPVPRLLEAFPWRRDRKYCVEISHRWLVGDPSALLKQVADLKRHGLTVAIDGLGLSMDCLESLVVLRPMFAKIDHRSIKGIAWDSGRIRALQRLVAVVRSLGIETVAEGVESPEDKAVVVEAGVGYAQGYLWGQPD